MSVRGEEGEQEKPSILIVDDEEANRVLLSALLGAHGYQTTAVENGQRALDELSRRAVDVLLLDVMMPGLDGLEVCRRVRNELGLTELTIVFITALSDRDSRVRAKAAGASDFLVKPIDRFELSFRVDNWLKLKRLSRIEEKSRALAARLERAAQHQQQVAGQLRALCARMHPDTPIISQLRDELLRCAATLSEASEDA